MANFPTSPAVGEQFSTRKVTYRWNGSAWDIVEGVKQGTVAEYTGGGSDVKLLLHAEDTTDSSMSAHSMTVGGVAVSTTKKKFGSYSFSFDGTDDYLDCPVSSDLEIGTENFTIELWFNTTNGSADNWWRRIFSLKREGNVDNNLQIYINNSTNQLGVYKDSSNYADFGSAITDGNWHHVALVKYNGNLKTYIDGTCVWTVADTANYTSCQPRFGATGHENDNGNFDGYLDEIRISIGTAHYTTDFTPSTTVFENPSMVPVGSLQFTEGSEPATVANSSSVYATSSGMFVKNSSGTVSPLVAGASATATSVELTTVTSAPSGIASTGQMVHWDRSAEATPDTNVKLLVADGAMTDSTSNSHTLTAYGAMNDAATTKFSSSGSIWFDGSNDYVTIPDSDDWNFGSGDFTVECWLYFINPNAGAGVVNQSNPGASSDSSWIIWMDASGIGMYLSDGSGWDYSQINTTAKSAGQWYHVAAVRNGTSLKMYVNGTATGETTLPGGWSVGNSSRVLELGTQANQAGYYFKGYMEDLRITKGTAKYTADFSVPTENLTATTMGGTSGLYFVDADGNASLIKEDS